MNLTTISLLALFIIFLVSRITDYVFKIRNDTFYRPFHFAGGFFVTLAAFDITKSFISSIVITIIIGLLWEAYEWALWRYIPYFHKRENKPGIEDTKNDLLLDLLGSVSALLAMHTFTSV